MAVSLSALPAGRPLPPGRFLVLISIRGWVEPRAIVRLEGLGKLKKKIHLIGTRTRDLPACTIVPQPTTLPRAPSYMNILIHLINTEKRSDFVYFLEIEYKLCNRNYLRNLHIRAYTTVYLEPDYTRGLGQMALLASPTRLYGPVLWWPALCHLSAG
jgi:hypothetical protein